LSVNQQVTVIYQRAPQRLHVTALWVRYSPNKALGFDSIGLLLEFDSGSLYSNFLLTTIVEKVNPIKVYANLKNSKSLIYTEQKRVSGVYMLVNLKNGHDYIGSSINIGNRMGNYLSDAYIYRSKDANIPIIKAIAKYGQHNFALLIIENTPIKELAVRETFFYYTN